MIAYGTQYLPGRWARSVIRSAPSLFLSVPNFIIGLLLIHYFSFQLHTFDVLNPDNFVGTLFAGLALGDPDLRAARGGADRQPGSRDRRRSTCWWPAPAG